MKRTVYETQFNLTAPVIDMGAAIKYLTEDDMTEYLHGSWEPIECAKDVIEIRWELQTPESGRIVMLTTREFTEEELAQVSDWVRGQNSDGLGEGFEQQPFACYCEDDDWDCETMASFDWDTNDYTFTKREERKK